MVEPCQSAQVLVTRQDGSELSVNALVRIDAVTEVEYFRNNGILPMVLREISAPYDEEQK